jgi:two-component system sensor histidine kinase AgrC
LCDKILDGIILWGIGGRGLNLYFIIIEPIFTTIIWCILYYNIRLLKFTKNSFIKFFLLVASVNILTRCFHLGNIGGIFSLVILLIFECSSNKKLYTSILMAVICIGEMTLVDIVSGGIVVGILGFSADEVRNLMGPSIVLYLIAITLAVFISKGISILFIQRNIDLKNIRTSKILYTYIIITALVIYLNVTILGSVIQYLSVQIIVVLIMIFVLYCTLGITFAYIMHQNHKKNMELEMQAQENDRLVGYANLLEKQHDDLRAFKHDYMNILATMGGYIQLKDIDKLDKYFKEKILNGMELFKEDENLKLIKKVQSIPVRGMLYAKLIRAQKAKVDLELCILNDIPLFEMNELDICKIIGILIDNAIEATSDSKEKKLIITMSCKRDRINICISNSFDGNISNVNVLYNKGYSTKGEGRGLGLHTVKSLLDSQYKHTKLITNIQENMFTQQIIMPITIKEI